MSSEEKQRMGSAIRRLRARRDIQAKELAADAGIRAETISSWENGHTFPDWPQLQAVANVLNITMAELIAEYEGLEISLREGRVEEETSVYEEIADRAARRTIEGLVNILGRNTEDRGR